MDGKIIALSQNPNEESEEFLDTPDPVLLAWLPESGWRGSVGASHRFRVRVPLFRLAVGIVTRVRNITTKTGKQ